MIINIGFGNSVNTDRVLSIVSPDSAPMKREIEHARDNHRLVIASFGRRVRAAIILDTGHIVLSANQPETLAERMNK